MPNRFYKVHAIAATAIAVGSAICLLAADSQKEDQGTAAVFLLAGAVFCSIPYGIRLWLIRKQVLSSFSLIQ